jgi:DNA polymerase I-like protein with 3'-5' exonuclease and polymerase domains
MLRDLVVADLNPPLNVTFIQSPDNLPALTEYLSRVDAFTIDLETNVTDSFLDRKIRTIQIGDRNEQYVIDLLAFAGTKERLLEQGWFTAPEWSRPVVDVILSALENRDRSYLKVGVNLQFEYQALYFCLGIRPWNFYDCWRVEQVLYSGKAHFKEKGFWGMEDMFGRYTGLRMDKSAQKSFDLESELTPEQIQYAALDCRIPFAIRAGQMQLVTKLKLEEACRIENHAIPSFGDMHLNGIYLDPAAWLEVVEDIEKEHVRNVSALDKFFIPVMGTKDTPPAPPISDEEFARLEEMWRTAPSKTQEQKDQRKEYRKAWQAANKTRNDIRNRWEKTRKDAEGEAAINYGSSHQLKAALYQMGFTKKKLPNTNDRTLETLKGEPVIAAIQEYRTTQKLLDTYGRSFLENIDPITGRVHSEIDQLGAESGRTSSSKPNLQNIPSRTEIGRRMRACFKAPTGYKFISVDMSGAELRILAELSGDPFMITAFANGWDLHSYGAEIIFGDEWKNAAEPSCAYYERHEKCKCKLHKQLRERIKVVNFMICYGGEAKKLSDDLGISVDDAKLLLEKWRKAFKVAWAYLQKSGESAKMTMKSVTLSGRIRYYPKPDWDKCKEYAQEDFKKKGKDPLLVTHKDISRMYSMKFGNIERQGKNSPIQGLNADILKLALGTGSDSEGKPFLWHQMKNFDAKGVLEVHDEGDFVCREDQAEEFVKVVADCYARAAATYMKKVPMIAEASISDRWQK